MHCQVCSLSSVFSSSVRSRRRGGETLCSHRPVLVPWIRRRGGERHRRRGQIRGCRAIVFEARSFFTELLYIYVHHRDRGNVASCLPLGVCVCVRAVACSRLCDTVEECVRVNCVLAHPGERPHGGSSAWYPTWIQKCTCSSRLLSVRTACAHGCLCARCLYITPCCLYSGTPADAV